MVETTMSERTNLSLPKLNKEVLVEYWSKTYNTQGKPDWSHLFPFYHEDIVFQDAIQKIQGKDKFEAMCNRLSKRCKSLQMDILNVAQEGNVLLMEWKMTMIFRHSPNTPLHGASRIQLHEDGRIIEQRDYYDLWGDIYDNVPLWRRFYRWFMRVLFG